MLKQSITYTDFNDVQHTEDFFFNLTKAELAEMEIASDMSDSLQRIVAAGNGGAIMKEFKSIIAKAYGVKSDDGKRFIKSPELSAEFEQTAAYDELFMRVVTDAQFAADFITGIFPKDIQERAEVKQAIADYLPAEPVATESPVNAPYIPPAPPQTPYGVPTQTQQL